MCFDGRAQTGGRDGDVVDFFGDIFDGGANFWEVGVDFDRDEVRFAGGDIEEVEFAELIIGESPSIGGEAANIGSCIVQCLDYFFGSRIVAEDAGMAVAGREEEDVFASIDGRKVGGFFMRDFD